MAERVTKIATQAFRGVPGLLEIELPEAQSLVVLGPNATGKSMLADAVEWYFKGKIEYLQREGRAEALRNAAAGPDVETRVTLETTGELGGVVTTGQAPPAHAVEAGGREFFLLRGRTLVEFIEKTKAEKWTAVAEILGFDQTDELRRDLQRASRELKATARDLNEEQAARDTEIAEQAGASAQEAILARLTDLCREVGIEPPRSFEQAVEPAWMEATVPHGAIGGDHVALLDEVRVSPKIDAEELSTAFAAWNTLIGEADDSTGRLRLFQAVAPLVSEVGVDSCPLCGQAVEAAEFRARVHETLTELRDLATRLDEARAPAEEAMQRLRQAGARRASLRERAAALGTQLPSPPQEPSASMQDGLAAQRIVGVEELADFATAVDRWDAEAVEVLSAAVPAPAGGRDQGFLALGGLVAAARGWSQGGKRLQEAQRASLLAQRAHEAYERRQQEVVETTLKAISGRVAELYGLLHPDGGPGPVAVETWGSKGLEVAVDFYGTPQRPAHRVLSESYLNALGLALFLAMAEQAKESLGFIVLDDVLTSFDIEHRGRLARLLTDELEDWQWIVLTHDPQLFDHLTKLAPHWARRQILGWDFADGPRIKDTGNDRQLSEAHAALDAGYPAGAAQKARIALESFLAEACEALGGKLVFKRGTANERRMAPELIAGVRGALGGPLKSHKDQVEPLFKQLEADVQAVLNADSHAGPGFGSATEVSDALERVEQLRDLWTCDRDECGTRVWTKGGTGAWRCRCGTATLPQPPEPEAG